MPVDLSQVLNAYGQLSQANALSAQRAYAIRQQNAQNRGALAGLAAGAATAAIPGGAAFAPAVAGGVSMAVTSGSGGPAPSAAQVAGTALSAYQGYREQKTQQANRETGQAVLDAYPQPQPVAGPQFQGNGMMAPGAENYASPHDAKVAGAFQKLQAGVKSGVFDPSQVAAMASLVSPAPTVITSKPGETQSLYNPRTGSITPLVQGQSAMMVDENNQPTMDITKARYQYEPSTQKWSPINPSSGRNANSINQNYMSQIKEYKALMPYADNVKNALEHPGPGASYSMLYNTQKALNPTSEVSGNEAEGLKNIGTWDQRLQGYVSQAQKGELSPAQMKEVAGIFAHHYQGMYQNYLLSRDNTRALVADQPGMTPEKVAPDYERTTPDQLFERINKFGQNANQNTAGMAPAKGPGQAVSVKTPADAAKLPPGTTYRTPDGRTFMIPPR